MKRFLLRVLPAVLIGCVLVSLLGASGDVDTVGVAAQGSGSSFLGGLFETYMPRHTCMFDEQDVIWVHLISDTIIAISYFTIPVALVYFVRKRKDIAFNWMFFAFAVFILACGTTHIFNIISIWQPYYRLDGIVKAITAIASIVTAIALWPLIPKALAIPGIGEMQAANAALTRMKGELEVRVAERTSDLETANASLRELIHVREMGEAEREQLLKSEQQARAEAENASRLKDEFVATLSHELRTPVNAVLGWTRVLRSPTATAADVKEGLETIERNTRVQVQLIEDLLDMSRILSGKLRLNVERVDLLDVIEASIATVKPAAEAKEILLQKSVTGAVGQVAGDANRLQQIVWNLLSNAVKFTPRGGRVELRLSRVGSHVEIEVKDTGQGVKADFLPHVFERFRQADASTTRRHGGLGLGLAIVRNLVELHGGSVRVMSEGEDKGTTFTVSLPVPAVHGGRAEEVANGKLGRGEPGEMSLKGLKVLVVDDEPDARTLVKRLLEEFGAKVVVASSAKEGYARIGEDRPQVIVSDIGMPDEDGYAFIRRIRLLTPEEGGMIPAIALTAFARAEDRGRALLAGFQMHIGKPVEPPALIALIASAAGLAGKG